VGPNLFVDTFNLTFSTANAIGFDFHPGPSAGNVAISVFDPSNVLLGSSTINATLGANFFGVISDAGAGTIGRINIASQALPPGELVDNLAFGNAVSEPGTFILLAGGLALAGLLKRLA
jgi:hypothetical protein